MVLLPQSLPPRRQCFVENDLNNAPRAFPKFLCRRDDVALAVKNVARPRGWLRYSQRGFRIPTVGRQRSLDRTGGLKKGEFLAHRNVHRSEDETRWRRVLAGGGGGRGVELGGRLRQHGDRKVRTGPVKE